MDPKSLLAALAKLLGIGDDTADEPVLDAPEGEEGDSIRDDAPPTDTADVVEDGAANVDAEAGDGVDSAAEEDADAEGETLPDSEVSEAELRNSLNELGAENERLRVILTEAGIDFEPSEEVLDGDETAADEDDEYDDEAAEADIAEQKRLIAEAESH